MISELSNQELHRRCQDCGAHIRKLQKEFAGLLVEVAKRRLYKQYGFYSIHEYAAKLAGMNHTTVDEILRVGAKLEDKPVLQKMITEQGWGKLKVMANVATPETQKFWAEKVKTMSKATLVTFVQGVKKQGDLFAIDEYRTGSGKPEISLEESHSKNERTTFSFKIDAKTEARLRIFRQKLEKERGEAVEWNAALEALLDAVEGQVSASSSDESLRSVQAQLPAVSKRHIPAKVKHFLQQKYKGKCAYPNCKNHERLAHLGLIKNEELPAHNWKIQLQPDQNALKYRIDQIVNSFRVAPG